MLGDKIIHAPTIGGAYIELCREIIKAKDISEDEGRRRYALQSVLIATDTLEYPDEIIDKYGNGDFLDQLMELTFEKEEMEDFDVVPSFNPGAPSYYKRIQDGRMLDFVVKRLTRFPESKKAVMVFPTWDDYKQVLENPEDDYLPCVVAIQFRMTDTDNKVPIMNVSFFARSADAFQKLHGNMAAMARMRDEIVERLGKNLKCHIAKGSLRGLITDAHIYEECWGEAKDMVSKYLYDQARE